MHAITLISRALRAHERCEPPAEPVQGRCCVTGEAGQCLPRSALLGRSFTDQHLLALPGSNMVSMEAWWALKHPPERQSSWFCDGDVFQLLNRQGVRQLVLQGVTAEQWCAYVTTSYKKHGVLRAPVNTRGRQVWLFELLSVDCSDRDRVLLWWTKLNQFLRAGISRSFLTARAIPPGIALKLGIQLIADFETWAAPIFQDPLYQFLCYLLPSLEELRAEKNPTKQHELFTA